MAESVVISGGNAFATAGMHGMLHAPVAMTTVRQSQSPWLVETRYPPLWFATDDTAVWVLIGAENESAYRSMKPMVCAVACNCIQVIFWRAWHCVSRSSKSG